MNIITAWGLVCIAQYACVAVALVIAYFIPTGEGRGYLIVAAVLIALLGGYNMKTKPEICQKCGASISEPVAENKDGNK